jgi:DNA-directed RNA polymerase
MAELNKRDLPKKRYLDTDDYLMPSIYLASKLEIAIGQVVSSANVVRDWIKAIAKVFNGAGLTLRWTTPSGFVVHHEYRKLAKKRVPTYWGQIKILFNTWKVSDRLNTRKQTSGISPNFVHSMDASLMTLVINKCLDAGITDFAMVHDSFGCHAMHLDSMNTIIREAFVDMYSTNVLEDFRNQVLKQLPPELHDKVPPVPDMGTLNLSQVRQSKYFCH